MYVNVFAIIVARFQEYLDTFPDKSESTVMDAMRLLADAGQRQWGRARTVSHNHKILS